MGNIVTKCSYMAHNIITEFYKPYKVKKLSALQLKIKFAEHEKPGWFMTLWLLGS
jgi:hypothetical protein